MLSGRRALLLRLAGLAGTAAALPGCGVAVRQWNGVEDAAGHIGRTGRAGRLTAQELQWAKVAWRYVENNSDIDTGLVNSVDRQPVVTGAGAAEALAALVAAFELGVIEPRQFDLRMSRLLGFLAGMDLSGGALPAKAYNAITGKMVNFENRPEDIGWSAVDVGRLLAWLKIVGQRHPRFQEYADKVVLRWNFCQVIDDCGTLYGTARSNGQVQRYQEGRLGYEQLAAAGYAAWGFATAGSGRMGPTSITNIYGLPVRHDARDARSSGVQTPVLTMPHVLMGMEFGWAPPGGGDGLRELAGQIYRVQEERYRREGQFTARTEYQTRGAPYVVLDAVHAAGYPWNTIGADGREYEKLALVSTRAAFGLWALWPGDYTNRLIEAVQWLHDPDRGWYEGRLEAGGAPLAHYTLATNAAVLEALLFKVKGRLHAADTAPGYFQRRVADVFRRTDQCLPHERPACAASAAGR